VKRILIADDDPLVCKLVSAALGAEGHVTRIVGDGKAALDMLGKYRFDLLVLDIIMPEMDGWQLMRTLRSRPDTALLPVIFLTARNLEEDRIQGFKLGADDYLPKPFNVEELALRVNRILKRSRSTGKTATRDASMEGSLSDIGLGPLLTLLEMEKKSGLLRLSKGDSKCIFYLRDGDVIRTRRNGGGLRGTESIYDALKWPTGTFHFKSEKVSGTIEIEQSTLQLLMEASRRIDEHRP